MSDIQIPFAPPEAVPALPASAVLSHLTLRAVLAALKTALMAVARKIGFVQTYIVTTVIYFIALGPFALAVRAFMDPLSLRGASGWRGLTAEASQPPGLDSSKHQF